MNETQERPQGTWRSPYFIAGDGGLTIHQSLQEAESYLEPEDIDIPVIVYDSAGTVWRRIVEERRIRLIVAAEMSSQVPPLASQIRTHLEELKSIGKWHGDDEWLATASLESLVREAARIEAGVRGRSQRGYLAIALLLVTAIVAIAVFGLVNG